MLKFYFILQIIKNKNKKKRKLFVQSWNRNLSVTPF